MENIPVRFKRVAAAFDEMARVCSCESSGSEHPADLSDLVNSFFESEIRDNRAFINDEEENQDLLETEIEINSSDQIIIESRESLKKIFVPQNDAVRSSIHAAVSAALGEVSGENFKRRLMARLRSSGFDAGICKSKWEKNGRNPSGNYEYIDVNAGGDDVDSRYIIEVNLAGEFTIARPAGEYDSLLENFPKIFVGRPEELKEVIRIMSKAIRKSMKSVKLTVPPWRRLGYMQAKWFGFYKRTVNEIPARKACDDSAGHRFVGFAAPVVDKTSSYCREVYAVKSGGRIGNLTAALK